MFWLNSSISWLGTNVKAKKSLLTCRLKLIKADGFVKLRFDKQWVGSIMLAGF